MIRKLLFYFIIGYLGTVLFFSCTSPDKKSNKLFNEAVQLVESAQEVEKTSFSDALKFYTEALKKIKKIQSKYPSTLMAKELISGEARIGPFTITKFKEVVVPRAKMKVDAVENPLAFALFVVETIKDSEKSRRLANIGMRLANIASAYAKGGQYDKALQISEKITNSFDKAMAWVFISMAYIEVNQKDKAFEILSQALQITKTMEPYSKVRTMGELAGTYAEAGQKDKASEILSQALQVAKTMKYSQTKDRLLVEIAGAYAKAGQYDKALQIADKIEVAHPFVSALADISVTYAKAGQYDKALQLAEKIMVEYSNIKARTLAEIAVIYAKTGQCYQALQLAKTIIYSDIKPVALIRIGVAYAEVSPEIDERTNKILHKIIRELE